MYKAAHTVGFALLLLIMTLATLMFSAAVRAYGQSYYQPAPTIQIVQQPMYTAPGQSPLILPPTNPYAPAQAYIQGLPTQRVKTCSQVPTGNGSYVQRCW